MPTFAFCGKNVTIPILKDPQKNRNTYDERIQLASATVSKVCF
tara:strand:+ start:292 stop:420 length:129 start_codon:yes stop_codon:yes gene_type:complete